ncbi:uncharacterized protein LOC62_03G004803 [Vanrija pseudolonga]|uniref:Uncharacterized protein n=1 Tax=Vanrija pseudolonga TaxID=143232 RepID=A0AAF0YAM7_9TREE|nr:hypothetical protein LOC62_03G004803 [Vanrija pseudolonga]
MLLTKLISAALLLALPAAAATESRQLDARLNAADRRELLVPQRRDAPARPKANAARQAPDMVTTCGTPQFKGQLQALQCTLGSNGAGKFGDLLGTLSTTAGGCNYVYPLVTKAMTVLAPQDSAMTPELVGDFTCNPGLLQQYYSTTKALHRSDFLNQSDRTIDLASVTAIYWVGGMASLWMEIQGTTTEAVVLTVDISTATGTAVILKNAWGQPATLV